MSQINEFFVQSELALASYATFSKGEPDQNELINAGMSLNQADNFASKWRVIDQYTDFSGVSATVFENIIDGKRYLAIRGKEITDPDEIVEDGGTLFNGIPDKSAQYQDLKNQIKIWQQSTVLPYSFTVAGHSLGGWLAGALAVEFPDSIEHAYLYNAPGLFGFAGELIDQFNQIFGTDFLSIDLSNISNIRASVGLSPISGLGQTLAPVVGIEIEDHQLGNHSIKYLTDALAVYNLFATVDPTLGVETIGNILAASSNQSLNSMEAAVSTLGVLLLTGFTPRAGSAYDPDCNDLYADIRAITAALSDPSGLTIEALFATDSDGKFWELPPDEIAKHAPNNLANRYALINLNHSPEDRFAIENQGGRWAA